MATYQHTITINDSESIMLESALQFMIEVCEKEMATNPRAPYYAHLQSAKAVMARLNDDMVLTSKSDFSV
jgi:hypothetical protein